MDFWKKPAHHPDVACATCHDVDKGLWNAAFHFSFSAKEDVVNTHCLGCHKKDLDIKVGIEAAAQKASYKGRPVNELVFMPHSKHVKDLGIKCTYCHSNVFHERRPTKFATYRPTMDTCYTCHDEEKTPCDKCHPKGMPSGVSITGKIGGGKMIYAMIGAGDVVFNHKRHAAKGLTCDACHNAVFDMKKTTGAMTMARMYAGKDCGHCHNGMGAFASTECARCHEGGVKGGGTIAYPGGGSGKVLFSHDRHMGMGLKCDQCHNGLFGYKKTVGKMTMQSMDGGKSCGSCHNGKKAFSSQECQRCHQMG